MLRSLVGSEMCIRDSHLSYDAPCSLRQQPYKRKRQSHPFCLNGMSLYRAYFVPGGMDPSGLTCRNNNDRTDAQCCLAAEQEYGDIMTNPKHVATVICCDGRHVICINGNSTNGVALTPVTNLKALKILKRCLLVHENSHIADSRPCIAGDIPIVNIANTRLGISLVETEVRAYRKQVTCVKDSLNECEGCLLYTSPSPRDS